MHVTWDDSDESYQFDDKDDSGNCMTFVTFIDCPSSLMETESEPKGSPSELKGNDFVSNNANCDIHEDVPGNLDLIFDPIVESLSVEINF